MGNSNHNYLPKDLIDVYEKKTFLSEQEIQKLFKIFRDIYKPGDYDYRNIRDASLSCDEFISNFKPIKENPFKDRLFRIFSEYNPNGINFEETLEMMSVFAEMAPIEVKTYYAFKLYNFDDDNYLSKDDLLQMLKRIVNCNGDYESRLIQSAIDGIIKESDLDKDGKLSYAEFELLITKIPDFMNTFVIKI